MNEKSFWNKYRKYFVVTISVLIVTYVIIYVCFRGDGIITAELIWKK